MNRKEDSAVKWMRMVLLKAMQFPAMELDLFESRMATTGKCMASAICSCTGKDKLVNLGGFALISAPRKTNFLLAC